MDAHTVTTLARCVLPVTLSARNRDRWTLVQAHLLPGTSLASEHESCSRHQASTLTRTGYLQRKDMITKTLLQRKDMITKTLLQRKDMITKTAIHAASEVFSTQIQPGLNQLHVSPSVRAPIRPQDSHGQNCAHRTGLICNNACF